MISGDSWHRKAGSVLGPGTCLCLSEFVQEDQAESPKNTLAGSSLGSSGFSCSFSCFLFPLEKQVFSIADSKMERTNTIIHNSVKVFPHVQKNQVEAGKCRAPPPHHCHLWALDQTGTTPVAPHQWVASCCSSGHRGGPAAGWLGQEACQALTTVPFLSSDAGDMIEMQGFGPSLPAWHLEPPCGQGSPCPSCSTSSSPYATPRHCTCVPDR